MSSQNAMKKRDEKLGFHVLQECGRVKNTKTKNQRTTDSVYGPEKSVVRLSLVPRYDNTSSERGQSSVSPQGSGISCVRNE